MPDPLCDIVAAAGGIRPAARELGIPESTLRHRLKRAKEATPLPDHAWQPPVSLLPARHVPAEGQEVEDRWEDHKRTGRVRRYILTSAQNNCEVHKGFLANLRALAEEVDADIMTSLSLYDGVAYRGCTARGRGETRMSNIWWDNRIEPYLVTRRVRLARRLAFCGEMDILASARDPLSGLDAYCGRSSIILAHNKFAFRCVESRKHQMPKEMFTTGSLTLPRFVQRKTGQLAQFHHVIGALLVEVTATGHWHVHHLNAEDDGSFYWLDRRVENGEVRPAPDSVEAVVLGDIHVEKLDQKTWDASKPALRTLKPRHIVVHDLIDFTSRNHHNRKDPFFHVTHRHDSVEAECKLAYEFVREVSSASAHTRVWVIASNHDAAMLRWLKETDWRTDPTNAVFYLRRALEVAEAAEEGRTINPLEQALREHTVSGGFTPEFLELDDSLEIAGVECGIHGHIGPSGSRGTPRGMRKLGFKSFTAHAHTPSINDGCYTVGVTGKLDMEYNHGPSKWMHAHGIIYKNGKRAFIFIKDENWRAP